MSEQQPDSELIVIEASLASLQPRPSRLDRDRVMYLAGQASVERAGHPTATARSRWLWPSATAAMTIVAGVFAALYFLGDVRPSPQERFTGAPVAPHPQDQAGDESDHQGSRPELAGHDLAEAPKRSSWNYFHLRNVVLADGSSAWPSRTTVAQPRPAGPEWRAGSRLQLEELID